MYNFNVYCAKPYLEGCLSDLLEGETFDIDAYFADFPLDDEEVKHW